MTSPKQIRDQAARTAQEARRGAIAAIGAELMNRWNAGRADPSQLAVTGHDTATGFGFCLERDGVTYTVAVTRDLGE